MSGARDGARGRLALIAAVGRGGVIGREGDLPWRLPDELRHFKRTTTGHCLIVGRRTWESLPGTLPGRTPIVLTRDERLAPRGDVAVARSLDEAIALAREQGDDEPIVGGGAAVYALALPRATRLWLTRVHADVAGDVRFPDWDAQRDGWQRVAAEPHAADERHAHAFTIEEWVRADPPRDRPGGARRAG